MRGKTLEKRTGYSSRFFQVGIYVFVVIACIVTLFPVFWIISTSLRTPEATFITPPRLLPPKLTIQGYLDILSGEELNLPFYVFFMNSAMISVGVTITALVVSLLAGYALARFRLGAGLFFMMLFVVSQMFPGAAILVPIYTLVDKLGLIDTRLAVAFVHAAFQVPFATFLLMGYIKSLPAEIEDAAMIDGCSHLSIIFRIVAPLIAPALAAVAMFSFIGSWNEFLYANLLTMSTEVKTLAAASQIFFGEHYTNWNRVTAGVMLFALPPIILFVILQKQFVSGLMRGAVKQ